MSANKCRHATVQQFTEMCLDCGRNIYETDAEYEHYLASEIQRLEGTKREKRIRRMEDRISELKEDLRDDDEIDDRF
jgi:hypothetical protein